jgi:hypothetical protein
MMMMTNNNLQSDRYIISIATSNCNNHAVIIACGLMYFAPWVLVWKELRS